MPPTAVDSAARRPLPPPPLPEASPAPAIVSLAELSEMSPGSKDIERLVALGYHEDIAGTIARNFDAIEAFDRPFYGAEATKQWDDAEGLTVEADAINYVDPARHGEAAVDAGDAKGLIDETLAPVRKALSGNALFNQLIAPKVEPQPRTSTSASSARTPRIESSGLMARRMPRSQSISVP